MGWRNATLYVDASDLARSVVMRTTSWRDSPLGPAAVRASLELQQAVALALTFPEGREARLQAVDEAIVRLREVLRLAGEVGLIAPGGLRAALLQLDRVGRRLGGWRRAREPPPF